MDRKRREELRAVCDAATGGPWTNPWDTPSEDVDSLCGANGAEVVGIFRYHGEPLLAISKDNARFIATARTALPEALDEIDRLRAALEHINRGMFGRRAQGDKSGRTDWEIARDALGPKEQ